MSNEKDSIIHLLELKMQLCFAHGLDIDKRSFRIVGEIGQNTFEHVDSCLNLLESTRKPITIKINSEGGSVYDAFAIISRINASPCNITTEGYGCIMSAAGLILASGDKRRMSKIARFMYHELSTEFAGKVSMMQHELAELKREQMLWAELMQELTNKSKEYWLLRGGEKDLYLNAAEALNHGIVNEIF